MKYILIKQLVVLFLISLFSSTSISQLNEYEKNALREYMEQNTQLAQYDIKLRNKIYDNKENYSKIKQCAKSLLIIKAEEYTRFNPKLKDDVEWIKTALGVDYLLDVFPKNENVKGELFWVSEGKNKYPCSFGFIAIIVKYENLIKDYVLKRSLIDSKTALEAIQFEYAGEYSNFKISLSHDMKVVCENSPSEIDNTIDEVSKLLFEATYQNELYEELKGKLDEKKKYAENDLSFCSGMLAKLLEELKLKEQTETIINLAGNWNGGNWGDVIISGSGDSYTGIYSKTFGKNNGTFNVNKSKDKIFSGNWDDPDGIHKGNLTLTVTDNNSISVSWEATDGRNLKNQNSVWSRK